MLGRDAADKNQEDRLNNRLYVGNLPREVTAAELEGLFTHFGKVRTASVVTDRQTGDSRGFGFVEMVDAQQAQTAIEELNGHRVGQRFLVVNAARE